MQCRRFSSLFAAFLLLTSLGCARMDAATEPASLDQRLLTPAVQPAWTGLPAPSSLSGIPAELRSSSYVESDLTLTALSYSQILPSQNVRTAGTRLAFEPTWTSGADGFGALALAGYVFNIPGYERNATLRSAWSTPPAQSSSVWLALANWDTDRWDTFASPADYKVELASLDPYVNFAGSLVVMVLRNGTDLSRLASISIGSPLPTAVLQATPNQGPPPLDSLLDASQSSAAEGSLVKYEFDSGDGVFVDNGLDPTFESHYEALGQYQVRVRVTDSQGGQSVATRQIFANGPWTHTWTRDHYDEVLGLTASADGDIYACGTSANDNLRSEATVWKYNALGELLWVRAFSDPGNGRFKSCAVDANGDLVLCGSNTTTSETQGLVQKWDSDGQIIWARQFGNGAQDMQPSRVILDSSEIYLPGTLFGSNVNDPSDALILRVSTDGELVWVRNWGAAGDMQDDSIWGATGRISPQGNLAGIIAVGSTGFQDFSIPVWEPSPLLVEFGTDGEIIRSWRLGGANMQSYFTAVGVQYGAPFEDRITAIGIGVGTQIMVRANLSGLVEWDSSLVQSGQNFTPSDVAFSTVNNGVLALGKLSTGPSELAVLTSIDSVVSGVLFQRYWPASGQAYFQTMDTAADGSLFIGGASFNSSGEFADLAAGHTGWAFQYETLPGTISTPFVQFAEDNDSSVALEGQLDTITSGRAALVMHLPPQ